MVKISYPREKIRLYSQEHLLLLETESWLKAQSFCKDTGCRPQQLSLLYLGREFCLWPNKRNYYFSKKMICFPGGHKVEYRYVGFTQGRLLVKMKFKMPEYHKIGVETFMLLDKDKDFLLW